MGLSPAAHQPGLLDRNRKPPVAHAPNCQAEAICTTVDVCEHGIHFTFGDPDGQRWAVASQRM
eukprot:2346457-Pyramimonas_sp.AAC.2